ncbi:MAG: GNAT family N-acetyltransferase [Anaerolineae bacterium]|nr:GNAT family N-acetyltransferase [Anaerolineae bacterium]
MVRAEISEARFPDDLAVIREIFREYAASLGVDLCFQNFDEELATLPGKYATPAGQLLLAWEQGRAMGCVALRPMGEGACEMKRLYVRAPGRGQGLGRRLAEAICAVARDAGYQRIRLDTLATMTAAQEIYLAMGFKPIPAYVFNPIEGTRYLELDLTAWHSDD